MTRVWLLNLWADLELAGEVPSRAAVERARALAQTLRGTLVPPSETVLEDGAQAQGVARFWCPTARARAEAAAAGLRIPDAPSDDVLRKVNHRRFLASELDGARFVERGEPFEPREGRWRAKAPWSHVGRHQRVMRAPFTEDDRAWLRRWPGVQVEPEVAILREVGTPGFVRTDGRVVVGVPVAQTCRSGAWQGSRPAEALPSDTRATLRTRAADVGERLRAHGYFGPFGVDAFAYVGANGEPRWNHQSELNARYTMGWALGWPKGRPDLE